MGIENRDYAREDGGDSSARRTAFTIGFGGENTIVRNLIVISLVVFVLQCLLTRDFTVRDLQREAQVESEVASRMLDAGSGNIRTSIPQDWIGLDTHKVKRGQVWRLLTAGFCHRTMSLYGLVINMVILYWLGRSLEERYGSRAFLWFYLTAIMVCSIVFVAAQLLTGGTATTMGSSGAIMATLALYAARNPGEQFYFFGILAIPIPLLAIVYVVYNVSPLLIAGGNLSSPTSVAHLSHLFGVAYGLVFWKTEFSFGNLIPRFGKLQKRAGRTKRGQKRPRSNSVIDADHSNSDNKRSGQPVRQSTGNKSSRELDTEVDRILGKISELGKDSLSGDELRTLEKASRHYGQKN